MAFNRGGASRTMVEHKPPESNKSVSSFSLLSRQAAVPCVAGHRQDGCSRGLLRRQFGDRLAQSFVFRFDIVELAQGVSRRMGQQGGELGADRRAESSARVGTHTGAKGAIVA